MIFYRWKIAKAAVQGVDHIQSKTPCQDRVASFASNGIRAIALADGAGSRQASQYGAEIVTHASVKYLVENFDDLIISTENEDTKDPFTAFYSLREKLIVHLNEKLNDFLITNNKLSFRDLASTLLFVVFDSENYLMGHIGDGIITSYQFNQLERYTKIMSTPENGAESHITYFFTEPNVSKHLRIYRGSMRNILGFVLLSDGPEEVLFDPSYGLNPNLESIYKNFHHKTEGVYNSILSELLSTKIAKFSYDDLSIIVAYLDEWLYNNEDVQNEFIDDIRSKYQIKPLSKNAYMLDGTMSYNNQQFSGFAGMMEFIRGNL
jgi:hypothetical protein